MSEQLDPNTADGRTVPPDATRIGRGTSAPPPGLADRLDDLVLRFDMWRERPGLIWSLVVVAAIVAGLGWWLGRPPDPVPIENLIPRADPGQGAPADPGRPSAVPIGGTAGEPPSPPGGDPGLPIRSSAEAEAEEPDGGPEDAAPLVVHVVGEVMRPGLVNLDPGSRIDDAVAAAGGVTALADVERLNLAAPVGDGTQIRVPAVGEEVAGPLVVVADPATDPAAGVQPERSGPINLNTADAAELESLPGIGPATAAAIIAWRDDNGGFLTTDDLTQVPGIGPVKLAALGDLVTV